MFQQEKILGTGANLVVQNGSQALQVLVIEDETEIRELISVLLLRQGYRVQLCASAVEGFEALKKSKFDLIVLDWMLPQMSGVEFLEKTNPDRPPVLMVTARTEPRDIVHALESGADDYITKPFDPAILIARAKALLRRAVAQKKAESTNNIKIAGIEINLASYEVSVDGEKVHLTPSEYRILAALAQAQGTVLTRDQLIELVQGQGISVTGRTIDTHVFGLRKKLGDSQESIETIRGVGYRVKA